LAKTIFIDKKGNIHFGMAASSPDFKKASLEEVKKVLKNIKGRKFWECVVCHDLHFNDAPPKECPTCHHIDSYKEITQKQFEKLIGL